MKWYLIVVSTLPFIFLTENVRSQDWTKVTLPVAYYFAAPYFINEDIGFVFDGQIGEPGNLCRTTDGGENWNTIKFFDPAKTEIHQLYFVSINHGYAATSKGIFETADQGNTWKNIYQGKFNFSSVYATDTKVFAFGNKDRWYAYGPLIKTEDDGKTWDTIYTEVQRYAGFSVMRPNILGNKENLFFCTYIDKTGLTINLGVSKDSGNTWVLKSMDTPDVTNTAGLLSFPHCFDLLRIFSHNGAENNTIVGSTDLGDSWEIKINSYSFEINSWISGNNCILYGSDPESNGSNIGDTSAKRRGIWRSVNRGIDWVFISGPNFAEVDDPDFHNLSVVGGGAVVYAGTISYNDTAILPLNYLWKTTNGGDGTLSSTALASHISINDTLQQGATICDTSILNIFFQNLSCNHSLLKSFSIDGLDSTQYSSVWKHYLACDGSPDSLRIKIYPQYPKGTIFTFLGHFMNDEFQTIDTSFIFTLLQVPGNIEAVYLKRFRVSGNAGDTVDFPTFINSPQMPSHPSGGSVDLTYTLNTDLLTPFAFIPIKGVLVDHLQITKRTATVTLHFNPGFTFSGETELGKLRCAAYVTDTLETDINLIGVAHSSGCLTVLVDSNSVHFTLSECGASTLSKYMKGVLPLTITSIRPNPAQDEIEINLRSASAQNLTIEIFDALGAKKFSEIKNMTSGSNTFHIDTKDLGSGMYLVRVGDVSKSLVISR